MLTSSIPTTTAVHTLRLVNAATRNHAMAPLSVIARFVLCRAKLLVVAVTPLHSDAGKSDVAEQALDHVVGSPFEIVGFLADGGFYDGSPIERLDTVAPVALPIIRGGEQMAEKLDTSVSTG